MRPIGWELRFTPNCNWIYMAGQSNVIRCNEFNKTLFSLLHLTAILKGKCVAYLACNSQCLPCNTRSGIDCQKMVGTQHNKMICKCAVHSMCDTNMSKLGPSLVAVAVDQCTKLQKKRNLKSMTWLLIRWECAIYAVIFVHFYVFTLYNDNTLCCIWRLFTCFLSFSWIYSIQWKPFEQTKKKERKKRNWNLFE